jgi:hypothetical protein
MTATTTRADDGMFLEIDGIVVISRFTLSNGRRVSCMKLSSGKLFGNSSAETLAEAVTTLDMMRECGFRAVLNKMSDDHFDIAGEKTIK